MISGVLFGLGAAFCQSCSYLCSRFFLRRHGNPVLLLALSHVFMGAFSLALLPKLWPAAGIDFGKSSWLVLGSATFYFAGQGCFFMALRRAEASRLSPLLGVKVFILASLSVLFLDGSFSSWQWVAVALCVIAAVTLNWTGEAVAPTAVTWILAACLGYSLSDIFIKKAIDSLTGLPTLQAALLAACLVYVVCAAVAIPMIAFFPRTKLETAWASLPYAVAWFAAMLLLFACFAHVNVVYGNIIQSSRGVISIALGVIVAKIGFDGLEKRVAAGVVFRRALAAVLMTAAIALFYFGKR